MFDGAVLVPRPVRERSLKGLGMRGSETEIVDTDEIWGPDPRLAHEKPDGWWLAGWCHFEGEAWPLNRYDELSAAAPVVATDCTASLCIKDGRLLAIVSPNDLADSAVWVAATCSGISLEETTPRALRQLNLAGNEWTMSLVGVGRLYRHYKQQGLQPAYLDEAHQMGQEKSLVNEVRNAATVAPRYPLDPEPTGLPAPGEGYEWVQEPTLGGIYRLVFQGSPTATTALVDREAPTDEQVRALRAIDWAPNEFVTPIAKAVEAGRSAKLWRPTLPSGRLAQPFSSAYFYLFINQTPATHPVTRYLWPSLSENGSLNLDPDEAIEHTWRPSGLRLSRHLGDDSLGYGREMLEATSHGAPAGAYVTNRRLVVVGLRDPAKVEAGDDRAWWAGHLRHEWIYEVGGLQLTTFRGTLFRARRVPTGTTEAFYARLYQASGDMIEMSIPIAEGEAPWLQEAIAAASAAVVRSGPERSARPEVAAVDEKTGGTVTRSRTWVDGAVPYSLPLTLA